MSKLHMKRFGIGETLCDWVNKYNVEIIGIVGKGGGMTDVDYILFFKNI